MKYDKEPDRDANGRRDRTKAARARAALLATRAWMARHRQALLIVGAVVAGLAFFGVGALTAAWYRACANGCPGADQIAQFEPAQHSEVYDINGDLIGVFSRERRRVVRIDDLPPHVPLAFVAIEDQRFFQHEGIDYRRLFGAVRDNLTGGFGATGGSTITMQLAGSLFPRQLPRGETSIRRKAAEMRVALEMEQNFSKLHILELYMNHINLGAGAYGVEAAARTYFGKSAAGLDYLEAATLAGLPQAPSRYNPRRNPELAERRRNRVLRFMAATGVISREEYETGVATPLQLAAPSGALQAPYFVEAVRRELDEKLDELLYTGGLRIYTTLDPQIQEAAEEALSAQLRAIENGEYGAYRHPTYRSVVEAEGRDGTAGVVAYLQGVATVLDARTGQVRAMVGGRDFGHSQFNRATQARRQSGSAFKPFVFAAAIEEGRSQLYKVSDERIHMEMSHGDTWSPRNYDGRYGGLVTMREGLQRSRNMVAIRLGLEAGVSAVQSVAQRAGIGSPIPSVPSVFIGAAGVYPIELVAAYAPFANGGMRVQPQMILRIEDHEGRHLWEPMTETMPAMDPGTAFLTTEMMRAVVDGGTGFRVRDRNAGNLPYSIPAAGKTGTTNNATDVWFVGFTPDLVGGVWIGMDRPAPIMRNATGGRLAAPVWARIMRSAYEDIDHPAAWERPATLTTRLVNTIDGTVTTPGCPFAPEVQIDYFLASAAPAPRCSPPQVRWDDPTPHLPGRPVFPGQPRRPTFDDR